MTLDDLHFHDAVLYHVTEDTVHDTLSFEVDYPVNWQNDVYVRKLITFTDVLDYQVHEGPFAGPVTFLEWSLVAHENGRFVVRLETNAGFRQLAFKDVKLSDTR